jgi:hypothetical protein
MSLPFNVATLLLLINTTADILGAVSCTSNERVIFIGAVDRLERHQAFTLDLLIDFSFSLLAKVSPADSS